MLSRILVANDFEFARHVVRHALKGHFEIVAEAENGAEALVKFREHKPDIILMDPDMPEMNGAEAALEILSESPDTRILVCSAVSGEAEKQALLSAGALAVVPDPYNVSSLLEILKRFSNSGSYTQEHN